MDRLQELKNKYQAALAVIQQKGVRLTHLHVQDDKLFMQGAAPSEEVKDEVWTQIKAADLSYSDVSCDLTVDPSLAPAQTQAAPSSAAATSTTRTYTVQPGDTLSKIAKEMYGNATSYSKIFEANRDKIDSPDKIRPGQQLTIPS